MAFEHERVVPADRDAGKADMADGAGKADGAVERIDLPSGRTLEIRPSSAEDGPLLHSLYSNLSVSDLNRRFFTGGPPKQAWCRTWASVGERGGHGVVAVVHDDDEQRIVGEAGYSLRHDGDGDLAVTVAAGWRSWLGAYLVDLLTRHAATHGVPNLQADVLLENRAMLGVFRNRGSVNLGHPDGTVRLSIGASGHLPSWPPVRSGTRVLVEVASGRWSGEDAAADADCVMMMCPGPARLGHGGCPVLAGDSCPLADEADAIVVLLDLDDECNRQLVDRHRKRRPGIPIFVVPSALHDHPDLSDGCLSVGPTGSETVAQILSVVATPQTVPLDTDRCIGTVT